MFPFACEVIPQQDQEIFFKIKKIIESLPEIDLGVKKDGDKRLISCHMLTRALAKFFPVSVKSGHFFREVYNHSWLMTKNDYIIDPYPIAVIGGPFLIDKKCPLYWRYSMTVLPRSVFGNIVIFNENVEKIVHEIEKIIKTNP